MNDTPPPGRAAHRFLPPFVGLPLLYVASGLPLGLLTDGLPTYLRRSGVELAAIGAVVSDVGLPWTVKFLWAPLLDRFGTRLRWARAAQLLLAAAFIVFAAVAPADVSGTGRLLLVAAAAFAATQDVAVDAWTIQSFGAERLGMANGLRTTAYRVGMILGGGILVAAASAFGWPSVWRGAGAAFALLAVASLFVADVPKEKATGVPLVEPLRRLATARGVGPFLWFALFVLLFKAGDYAMAPMTKPFLVDAGLTDGEIGTLGTIGLVAAIVGGLLGGFATTRWGTMRALWVLGLLQAVSNLGYAGAALGGGRMAAYLAGIVEPFCGGLGTTPFLALLMVSCDREHAGTQFALLSALGVGLAKYLAGRWSGLGAEAMGYAPYFALTFVVALPAFALLPHVRRWHAAATGAEVPAG